MPRVVSLPNAALIEGVRRLVSEGHSVTLSVRGVSMRPFLEDRRDKAIIAPCADPHKGDAVLAEVAPGKYVLHRVIGMDGDRLVLMGDGNVAGVELCRRSDVIGRATGFLRKGRTVPDATDGLKWRLYSAVWTRLRPVRRYLLAFYRLVWLKLFSSSYPYEKP